MVGNDFVNIAEGNVFDIHELSTNFMHCVVFVHHNSIRELVQVGDCKNRVVVLNYYLSKGKVKVSLIFNSSHVRHTKESN